MNNKAKTFQVGDRVAYAVAFLRSTCQTTDETPRLRSTVQDVQPLDGGPQLVVIKWDNTFVKSEYHDDGLGRVIAPNLTLVSRIAIDSALNT